MLNLPKDYNLIMTCIYYHKAMNEFTQEKKYTLQHAIMVWSGDCIESGFELWTEA